MTTPRFEVPSPSDAAMAAAVNDPAWRGGGLPDSVVRAAYAVDVPAIVRSEVERALAWYHARVLDRDPLVGIVDPTKQYVSQRFPEAAPEPDDRSLVSVIAAHEFTGLSGVRPTPSAPAEGCPRTCQLGNCRLGAGHDGPHETAYGPGSDCYWVLVERCKSCGHLHEVES